MTCHHKKHGYVLNCKKCDKLDCAKNMSVVDIPIEERLKDMFDRRKTMYEKRKEQENDG